MPDKELGFAQWYAVMADLFKLNPNPDAPEQAYDYRGFYEKNVRGKDMEFIRSSVKQFGKNPEVHVFTDEFKKPEHPTFSNESVYNDSTKGIVGGRWEGEVFFPSEFNKRLAMEQQLKQLNGIINGD